MVGLNTNSIYILYSLKLIGVQVAIRYLFEGTVPLAYYEMFINGQI